MIHEFDELKFDNVYGLLKSIHSNKLYSSAVSQYNTYYGCKEQTENLVIALKLVYHSNDSKKLIGPLLDRNSELINKNDMKEFLVEKLISENNKYSMCVTKFLDNFKYHDGNFIYTPGKTKRLQQSGLRNFLHDLGLVELQKNSQTYQLNTDKSLLLAEHTRMSSLNPELFIVLQTIKKEIGDKAEICVMSYEQKRLKNNSKLLNRLEHVALKNVSAGYDILSWERTTDISEEIPRYIEVKAVPADTNRFYWSSNEINMAKKYGELYCLYLVPRIKNNFLINEIRIIRNPIVKVFECDGWEHKIEKYSIWSNNKRS